MYGGLARMFCPTWNPYILMIGAGWGHESGDVIHMLVSGFADDTLLFDRPPQNSQQHTPLSSSPTTVLKSRYVSLSLSDTEPQPRRGNARRSDSDSWCIAVLGRQNHRAGVCCGRRFGAHLGDAPRKGPRGQGCQGAAIERRRRRWRTRRGCHPRWWWWCTSRSRRRRSQRRREEGRKGGVGR